MEHIWAPWRMAYIESEKSGSCILCENPAKNDDKKYFILYRGEENYVMLNLYPYNPYHLMVVPYRHTSALDDLSGEERNEHFKIVSQCVGILRKELNPAGYNIGINMGAVAGAGIEDHIHSHIIPRWQGDTNFVTVVSDIRVVPQALADSFNKLKDKFLQKDVILSSRRSRDEGSQPIPTGDCSDNLVVESDHITSQDD